MERKLVTSLDVGTTKVCTAVAEVGEDRKLTVLGIGEVPSEGLERGMVVNLEATIAAIEESVHDAERMSGVPIRSVLVGISGEHVRSLNSTGVIGVSGKDREITREDVARVLDAARAVAIPGDRELLHVLPSGFTLDDQIGIADPVGMSGVRLVAEVHIVTVHATAASNLLRAIERAGLEVDAVVLQPLAAAEAVVEDDEKSLGALLLDLGGGTTDIAVFQNGAVRMTAAIGCGGRMVSQDLAVGLRTPVEQAERLKLLHGCAIASGASTTETVEVPGVGGRESRAIGTQVLASIIEPRVEEILGLALERIEREIDPALLAGGVVLTGGGARMPMIGTLAERVLGLPARVGLPDRVRGVPEDAADPRFAASFGLLQYAARHGRFQELDSGMLRKVPRPVRTWLKQNFLARMGGSNA